MEECCVEEVEKGYFWTEVGSFSQSNTYFLGPLITVGRNLFIFFSQGIPTTRNTETPRRFRM